LEVYFLKATPEESRKSGFYEQEIQGRPLDDYEMRFCSDGEPEENCLYVFEEEEVLIIAFEA